MPAWALLVLKILLPLLLQELVKAGVFTQFQADAITDLKSFVVALQSLKFYREYPTGKNGQTEEAPPCENNINKAPE